MGLSDWENEGTAERSEVGPEDRGAGCGWVLHSSRGGGAELGGEPGAGGRPTSGHGHGQLGPRQRCAWPSS